jgi:hypothetical protein
MISRLAAMADVTNPLRAIRWFGYERIRIYRMDVSFFDKEHLVCQLKAKFKKLSTP